MIPRLTALSETYVSLDDTPFDARTFTRLWLLALATYGVGDVVTTIALIEYSPTVSEANALIRLSIDHLGLLGLVLLKYLAFGVAIGISLLGAADADRFLYYLPPIVLSLAGAFTTVYNARLMLG
ncbi:hypothetical protein [Halobellus clavatus]|jgi:hypothetical protein|uniref:DUF5658 domain-containing protein n=1 Tax=Halobellus clavatus TaxID=660517 RepID=A0A1H3DN40_9EURY|nr:hypothetical protein [Halobellus clavatus]SDX67084.1 hypothetical protein SAMN04487946_101638 [Halobellus clavatus]